MKLFQIQKPKLYPAKIIIPIAYIATLILFEIFQWPCLWKTVFHIPCPGCGISHAILYCIQGNLRLAFQTHFMFWSVPLLPLYYLFDGVILGKKWDSIVFISLGIGFFINWIYHLFL